MTVIVQTTDHVRIRTSPEAMAAMAGGSFHAALRVAGVAGEGFDLAAWYAALMAERVESVDTALPVPTHLIVKAADEFQAVIPWDQLGTAFFLYAEAGSPLRRGGPLRLYVPDGTSACLNVKNVVFVRFASDPDLGTEASYGFRNEISPVRLLQGYKSEDKR